MFGDTNEGSASLDAGNAAAPFEADNATAIASFRERHPRGVWWAIPDSKDSKSSEQKNKKVKNKQNKQKTKQSWQTKNKTKQNKTKQNKKLN